MSKIRLGELRTDTVMAIKTEARDTLQADRAAAKRNGLNGGATPAVADAEASSTRETEAARRQQLRAQLLANAQQRNRSTA